MLLLCFNLGFHQKKKAITEKEHEPKKNKTERERFPKDMRYNPNITKADKNVLNNQRAEEKMDGNFKNKKMEPVVP